MSELSYLWSLNMTVSDTYLDQVFDTMKATVHPSSCISHLTSKGSSKNKTRCSNNHPPSHSVNFVVTRLAPLFVMITYRVNMETKRYNLSFTEKSKRVSNTNHLAILEFYCPTSCLHEGLLSLLNQS